MAKIAIVDDTSDALELFTYMLADHHEFEKFNTAQALLDEFRPGKFALILLDLAMPGMDGFEAFQRIHAMDKDVPVVAVTAIAFERQRERALKAGFCDYFIKPIMDIEKFRESIYSHIGECANPPYDPHRPAA